MSTLAVSWVTSTPASSQVIVTNTVTGISVMTAVDPTLRTMHYMVIENLSGNTRYKLQAISVPSNGVPLVSGEIFWTTDAF